ncbi:MAG TPA: hypothetical protein VM261_10090 [Kofleriaceae bacterium]|nr:hypothetical protein [Kofleriaceae bacterium]
MSISRHTRKLALVVAGLAACATDDSASPSTSSTTSDLDVIGLAERPATLLVLQPTATLAQRQRLERAIVRLGGAVLETHAPRLVIAQVPNGADAALTALGVVAKFDRAVTPADLASPTIFEERFLSVHAARWFPADVPVGGRIAPLRVIRPAGEEESAPRRLPENIAPGEPNGGGGDPGPVIDPEDMQAVPFASGTVVVSVVLPESNGVVDASTEDWNEDLVRQTYLKVQAAIDKIAASEPNADLKFVVHYESAPAAGALPGTVDTDYEFGQRAQWGSSTEGLATADIMSSILGRTVTENDLWIASIEYTASLKARYGADAAFMVIVAANGNYTASLRAHAYIGGPLTVLDTSYGHETFAHEFGHIFGAYDEYCPDACSSPTSIMGYLGVYNANAAYQEGGPGIDDGKGEGAPSLMQYNQPGAVNGYTRISWGWLDTDGDGIIEVRDTFPKSALTAVASGNRVRVTGTITDRGESRTFGNVRYSANRITGLEFAFAANGPWFQVALAGDTRGRQAVDVELGTVPAGTRSVFVRGVSSVGNIEPRAQELRVTTTQTGNTAPYVRLDVPARAGTAAPVTITTTAFDLEGSATQVRYDLDGNGSWDTSYRAPGAFSTTLPAGLRTIKVQVKDAAGLTRIASAEVPVVSGAMAPVLTVTNLPSLVHGQTPANIAIIATAPGAQLEARAELATDDDSYGVKGPIGASGLASFALPTPLGLKSTKLDLTAGDLSLINSWIRDILALDADHVAIAAGSKGIWIVDITDRAAPRVMSRLALETSANKLYKQGSRLYVLGTYLAAVDIRDLTAPREWKQLTPVVETVSNTLEELVDLPDGEGWGGTHFYGLGQGAKITQAKVVVTVDHPRVADLVIRLVPGKGLGLEPVVLRDHQTGANGLRTYTFTSANTLALRAVHGQFADEYWTVEVVDDTANGLRGRLVSSRLELKTSAKAVDVIDNATEFLGTNAWGDLVIAGAGLEVLDVVLPQWITSLSRVTGTAVQGGTMVGDTAVVAMALDAKVKDPTAAAVTPALRGLCAVDLRSSFFPRVLRCDAALGGNIGELALVGGRIYQGIQPVCNREEGCGGTEPFTVIGDLQAFARGWAWQLGTTPLRVDHWAIGDARTVWTIGYNGYVQQLDVTSPTAVSVVKSYPRTFTSRMVKLRTPEVMLFDYSPYARIARLGDEQSILSRVYRVSVEARDAAGNATRAYRTVHVIPYDHAPTVQSAAIYRRDENDTWRVKVEARDADNGASWDPTMFARIDYDADGVFDTDWTWMWMAEGGLFTGEIDITGVASGTYSGAVVEVRDGFWARHRTTQAITIP